MKKVYTFLADGFELVEALAVVDVLRRGQVQVETISIKERSVGEAAGGVAQRPLVSSAQGVDVVADGWFDEIGQAQADMIFLPGGMPGAKYLAEHEGLAALLRRYHEEGRYIASICAAPSVPGRLGILKGRRATCYPGWEESMEGAIPTGEGVVQDGHIFTAKGMGCAIDLGLALLAALEGEETARQVKQSIQYQ